MRPWRAAKYIERSVYTHNARARRAGVSATLTIEEWRSRLNDSAGVCAYCGNYFGELLTLEHIIPISQGGGTTYENCIPVCEECNKEARNNVLYGLYSIDETTAAHWRRLAKSHGFLPARGSSAGATGNITALMEAVERGELEVRPVARPDEQPAYQENAS